MKVYIVVSVVPYEGISIMDVFSTKEKAEDYIIKNSDYDYLEIYERVVK